MDSSLVYMKAHLSYSPNFPRQRKTGNYSSISHKSVAARKPTSKLSLKCCKGPSGIVGWELERKLQKEIMDMEGGEEEEQTVEKWKTENCRESTGGVVELLECLEKEAIMGEDEGKEGTDYNRRAKIFDRSSRIFKASKESTSSAHDP